MTSMVYEFISSHSDDYNEADSSKRKIYLYLLVFMLVRGRRQFGGFFS